MIGKPFQNVSASLQRISNEVNASLRAAAGEECAFFLLTQSPDGVVHYISNASRPDATMLMRTQLEHWGKGKADIPALYNPDLKSVPSPAEQWRPMETAPRDATIIRLLVEFEVHSLQDSCGPVATIGHNNFDHDGEDVWLFAGWCWTHDHYTEGVGKPIGWLPFDWPAA